MVTDCVEGTRPSTLKLPSRSGCKDVGWLFSAMLVTIAAMTKKNETGFKGFLRRLGPGLVTGAADDDPSGIGTHSQVGAEFGYGLAWTFVLSFP